MVNEDSEEYDDENFREQAMRDLEAEIEAIEKEEKGEENDENQN